jgi:hypothetical protein
MAEPVLDPPSVVASIGERIAASVAQHVGVNRKGKAGAHADAVDQAIDGVGAERAAQRLGGETFLLGEDSGVHQVRMARVADVVLLDHTADHSGSRSINCYLVEVQDFTTGALGGEGKKFKIVPERLIHSLQWQHKAEPPDFELVLLPGPGAVGAVGQRREPDAVRRASTPGGRWANRPARGKSGNSTPSPASMSMDRSRLRTTTAFSAHSNKSGRNMSFSQAARAVGSAFVDIVVAGSENTPSLTTSTSISPTRSA